jgi:hypothetical protein
MKQSNLFDLAYTNSKDDSINMNSTIAATVIRALEYGGIIYWLKIITLRTKYNN